MFDLSKFKTDFVFKGKPRCLSLDYNDLIKYCKSPDFDPKMFKMMHDNYAKAFSRLNNEEQGSVVAIINLHHKWSPVLDNDDCPEPVDGHNKKVTAVLL